MQTQPATLVEPQAAQNQALEAPARAERTARLSSLSTILVLQSRAFLHDRFAAAASSVVADLATLLGCERVSLGILQGRRVHVATVSGVTDLRSRQAAVERLADAMQEALDQCCTIVHPLLPEMAINSTQAHAALAHSNGRLSTCTLPILCGKRAVGALLFERRNAFDAPTLRIAKDAALFLGPMLVLQWRARTSIQGRWQAFTGGAAGGHSPWRYVALAAAVATIVVCAWPTHYRVVATARVEGQAQRVIAAPVDGFVRSVNFRPGEAVRVDQVLLQLEDRDLTLEREKWESEVAKLDKQYLDALSRDEAGPIVIAASKLAEARQQLALAQRRLERTTLKAPFDGVLLSGDLTQAIGTPVKRGQELMTMATERAHRIVAEVEEQDVSALQVGQAAQVLFAALDQPVVFRVERIAPVATPLEGRNVFEVEGVGGADASALRPGLRGVAKIEIERSFVAEVWWRRASQWVRHIAWRFSG